MSQFLQKNKKKGLMALLLLSLQRGKGVGPLVLMVGLLAMIFVLPSGLLGRVPFLGPLFERFGAGGSCGVKGESSALTDAWDADREGGANVRTAGILGGAAGGGLPINRSGVDLVNGKAVIDKTQDGAGAKDGEGGADGKGVEGVPTPEDAKKTEDGVPVDNDELKNGLMNSDFAGMIKGMGGGNGMGRIKGLDSSGSGGGSGSGARWNGRLDKGRADDPKSGMLKSALEGSKVPVVGQAGNARAGGRLDWKRLKGLNTKTSAAMQAPARNAKGTAMYQLAEGRAYSIAAAPPASGGLCDPGHCPSEFASNASGAVFDGTHAPTQGIISSPQFGGGGAGSTPSMGQIATTTEQAEQMETDAKKCEDAEKTFGPQERSKMAEIQSLSDQLNQMDCNGGGCSSGKYKRCRAVGDQMKVKCGEYNRIAQQKAAACPLMNGQFSPMDCNQ